MNITPEMRRTRNVLDLRGLTLEQQRKRKDEYFYAQVNKILADRSNAASRKRPDSALVAQIMSIMKGQR